MSSVVLVLAWVPILTVAVFACVLVGLIIESEYRFTPRHVWIERAKGFGVFVAVFGFAAWLVWGLVQVIS